MALGTSLPARPTRPSEASPIFVSETGGDDSRTKVQAQTEGTPWKTVSKFLANAAAGDVCYVKNYPDQVANGASSVGYRPTTAGDHVISALSGTEGSPILLKAYPGHRPIILPATSSPTRALRFTGGSAWWIIDGFELPYAAGTNNDPVIYFASGANNNNEIFDCWIHGATQGSGILAEDSSANLHIYNNVLWANDDAEAAQSHGIYVQADNSTLCNNVCRDHANGFGIQLRTDTGTLTGVIVANNTCVRNKGVGSGILIEGDEINTQAWNNIGYDNGNYAIRALNDTGTGGSGNVARKNIANANDTGHFANQDGVDTNGWDWDGAANYGSPPGDNLTSDPLFVNAAGNDFHLQSGSPAIGYGNEAYCPTFDHSEAARVRCDAGAFAYSNPKYKQAVVVAAVGAGWQ